MLRTDGSRPLPVNRLVIAWPGGKCRRLTQQSGTSSQQCGVCCVQGSKRAVIEMGKEKPLVAMCQHGEHNPPECDFKRYQQAYFQTTHACNCCRREWICDRLHIG